MKSKVLILGGYGVFGQRISASLSKEADIAIIVAGRNLEEAAKFAAIIGAEAAYIDTSLNIGNSLDNQNPRLVINCCGPFQGKDYAITTECIKRGIHYIDLADARNYVNDFVTLHADAEKHNVIAITGASTVPAISSAVIDYFLANEFSKIHSVDYGVTPGNQTPRGIATVAAILSYTGKPFKTLVDGKIKEVFGWQNLHQEKYPEIGNRWMSTCDIPDLDIFCSKYPSIKTIRFYAGLELSILHLGLWLLSWLVRARIVKNLRPYAKLFRSISLWFYPLGCSSGGMHIKMQGVDMNGKPTRKSWYIIAHNGDGPQIPCIPAIILAKKIIRQQCSTIGAFTAAGLIEHEEIISEIKGYNIKEVVL